VEKYQYRPVDETGASKDWYKSVETKEDFRTLLSDAYLYVAGNELQESDYYRVLNEATGRLVDDVFFTRNLFGFRDQILTTLRKSPREAEIDVNTKEQTALVIKRGPDKAA
jgi:hypothetical protein